MSSFADCPLEVIEVVIDLLRDDLDALKACSQTCTALLPLCRKYIFQSLLLVTSSQPIDISGYSTYQSGSVAVIRPKFWHVLDANPTISEYVYTLKYWMNPDDSFNDDVPRVLDRLHHVRSFDGMIPKAGSKQVPQPFRDALLRIVQSHSITCLTISVDDFPITAFLGCVNLTDLSIFDVYFDSADVEQESSNVIFSNLDVKVSDIRVPRLQSFAFGQAMSGQYTMRLLNAKCHNGGPMLDFTNVRTLSVYVGEDSELALVHALVTATNKLETLRYHLEHLTGEYGGEYGSIVPSINKRSLSTLKRLHLSYEFDVHEFPTDFVCGICKELGILSGLPNEIEEIAIEAQFLDVRPGELCVWGMLDTVLSNGFPMLRRVSLNIQMSITPGEWMGAGVKVELDEISTRYLPLLSNSTTVLFSFSKDVFEF